MADIVIYQHTPKDPPGLLGEWLDARGCSWRVQHEGKPDALNGACPSAARAWMGAAAQ